MYIPLALDIETTGLDFLKDKIVSISFTSSKQTKSFLVSHPEAELTEKEALDLIQKYINKASLLIGHNIKFDLLFLKKAGIKYEDKNIFDTAIAKYILTYQRVKMPSLNYCSEEDLGELKVEGIDFNEVPANELDKETLLHYNEQDTKLTYKLYLKYNLELKDKGMDKIHKLSSNYSKVLVDMEYNGCKIDVDKLNSMLLDTKHKLSSMKEDLASLLEYPINLNSTQQLSCALYGGKFDVIESKLVRKKFKTWPFWRWKKANVVKTIELKGIGFSTKNLELNKQGYYPCDHDTIVKAKTRTKKAKLFKEKYKAYKKLNTLYEKYLTKYFEHVKNGFIHTTYQQTSTITGRLSSTNPNIQQIPRPDKELPNIKSLFVSRYKDGYILDIDFSQIEWRVAAILSNDKVMKQEIIEGIDAHKSNASLAFNVAIDKVSKLQRQIAKMVSFGVIYGQTAFGMANYRDDIPVNTEKEAQLLINTILNKYPKLRRMHILDIAKAKNKNLIKTPSGRCYNFRGKLYKETNIKNNKVQGFATADLVPLAIYEAWKQIGGRDDCKIINTVHDCLVIDCKTLDVVFEINNIVSNIFKSTPKLAKDYFCTDIDIPIDSETEYGKDWGNMEELKC